MDICLEGVRIVRISTVPFALVTQLKKQIEFLSNKGAFVTVLTSYGPEIEQLKGIHGVEVIVIDIPRKISLWRNFVSLLKIWHVFRKKSFSITHSTTPMAGLLTSIAALLAGVPIRLHTFTGQPWVDLCGVKGLLSKTGDKIIGILNTQCYTDSHSQMNFLVKHRVLSQKNLKVLKSGSLGGVDIDRFSLSRFNEVQRSMIRSSLNISMDASVLIFVGRITPDKGVHELIAAFTRIKSSKINTHLIFIGAIDTNSGVSTTITENELGSVQNIHLIGYSDCPEKYMAIADILCLPSYREGFGTVVIEAAAMGVPTVGSDICGLKDAVISGETGILVPPKDVNALYNGIFSLLSDKELLNKLGDAAKKRTISLFNSDRVSEGIVNEYHRLLDRSIK